METVFSQVDQWISKLVRWSALILIYRKLSYCQRDCWTYYYFKNTTILINREMEDIKQNNQYTKC